MKNTSQKGRKYRKTTVLTPAQKKFSEVYARTDNATQAVRVAYPEKAESMSSDTLRNKGYRMLTNSHIQLSIEEQKKKMEVIASKATERMAQLIASDDEQIALNSSKWAYEQVHGKATQKIESRSAHVEVVYNLGGENTPDMPDHIRKQLNQQG